MKRLIFLLLSTFIVFLAKAQMPILTDQLIEPNKKLSNKNYTVYEAGDIILYNEDGKNTEHFYIIDKISGKKIYEYDEPEAQARHLYPKFFMHKSNKDLIILCMSLEGNYSWGTHIFIIENGEVSHSGFLSYGADNFNFSGLALYSQFEQHDDWFILFFQDDVKLINYETDDLVSGSEIEFKIDKDKITRLK